MSIKTYITSLVIDLRYVMDSQVCSIHGLTKYNKCFDKNSLDNARWRCGKCQTESVTKRRREIKVLAVNYKGGNCNECGYSRSIAALEFHHRDPAEKDFAIGGKGLTRSFESLKVELDKCDLLCANCHREEHARQDSDYIGIDVAASLGYLFDEINN